MGEITQLTHDTTKRGVQIATEVAQLVGISVVSTEESLQSRLEAIASLLSCSELLVVAEVVAKRKGGRSADLKRHTAVTAFF